MHLFGIPLDCSMFLCCLLGPKPNEVSIRAADPPSEAPTEVYHQDEVFDTIELTPYRSPILASASTQGMPLGTGGTCEEPAT
jgi:hypothetical protein